MYILYQMCSFPFNSYVLMDHVYKSISVGWQCALYFLCVTIIVGRQSGRDILGNKYVDCLANVRYITHITIKTMFVVYLWLLLTKVTYDLGDDRNGIEYKQNNTPGKK